VIHLVLRALGAAALVFLSIAPAAAQTLEQMAGQMIVVGFAGDSVDDKSVQAVRLEIADGLLGGLMYLKPNVANLPRVTAMNAAFRAASPDLPPFLALDQEGGEVERLTAAVGFSEEPTAQRVAAQDSPEQAGELFLGMAKAIAAVGFTVNFGPVVDLNLNPKNQVIGRVGRAFGVDPAEVAAYAAAFIRAHHAAGLLTALKHFPGHGSSTADSHEGFVDITKTWQQDELDPYRTLIADGLVDIVMVGHLFNANYAEGEGHLPASLSPRWIDGVLRGELGFSGVVMSDDLEMGAIREHYSTAEAVLAAVRAGVDVLLFSNTARYHPGLAAEIRAILIKEAEADPAFRARIEQSYARIVALKKHIG
jgi:beta-N-acetylhexosaminidase